MKLKDFRSAMKPPNSRVEKLRTIVGTLRSNKRLDALPDQFAEVLEDYDALQIQPHLREDARELLAGAVDIAKILLNPTFNSDDATTLIAEQQRILAKVLLYLTRRPQKSGFSILYPKSHDLFGHFSTRAEAEGQLAMLQRLEKRHEAMVVPVTITSRFAVRAEELPPFERDPHQVDFSAFDDPDDPAPNFITKSAPIQDPIHQETLTNGSTPAPNSASESLTDAERNPIPDPTIGPPRTEHTIAGT